MALPQIIPSVPDLNLVGGISYDVQTNDDTPTVLFELSLNDQSAIKFNASVQAVATDMTLKLGYERNVVVNRDGASAALGIAQDPFTDNSDNPSAICYWETVGTTARLMVRGVVGKTINWVGKVSYQEVSV